MILFLTVAALILVGCLWAVGTFLAEKAWRAAVMMAAVTCVAAVLPVTAFLFFQLYLTQIALLFLAFAALALLILFLPYGSGPNKYRPATERFDERDIMFARARYQQGTEPYQTYYADKPDQKKRDDFTRTIPNLGEPGGKTWDPLNPQISGAVFEWIERVRETVDGPVNKERIALTPGDASRRLAGLAKYLGAADAGTTAVGAEHVYTHIGRGSGQWGEELNPGEYPQALVFTVEMNAEYIGSAPWQPALADSGRQYLEAAKIAFAIAEYIRMLGYPARAHVDGNYRLIMPTLAVEAGLGEIGRHSLLITPGQGTRVRIAAVTTELPLEQARRISFGVDDFCTICKKCAANCPSNSIPKNGKTAMRGTEYWKIDEESCYRMWRTYGTDCGICVNVCPYSRPEGLLHTFVRTACKQNPVSRRVFHALDDFFYGKRPRASRMPDWMRIG